MQRGVLVNAGLQSAVDIFALSGCAVRVNGLCFDA